MGTPSETPIALPPMLTLQLNSLSLEIGNPARSPYARANHLREIINTPQFSRSANGTSIQQGTWYECPHTWQVECLLKHDDAETLRDIYALFLATKPHPLLTLTDRSILFREPTPRTRPIAAGTTPTVNGSIVRYFAQFNVYFSAPPTFAKEGAMERVNLQLLEGEKLTA